MKAAALLLCFASGVVTVPGARLAIDRPRFVSMTAGADHACALTDQGDAYCWGSNELGQLGIGLADVALHARPERVRTEVRFATLIAGFTHTCALTRDGVVWCWGANDSAQLGDGTIANRARPTAVATDLRFKAIGPGGTHTCGVSVNDIGYCWGGNWHGQLGIGNRDGEVSTPCCHARPIPIRTDVRFRSVVAGGISSCGVASDGRAYCWGSPQQGRLGTGAADAENKSDDKTLPTAVSGNLMFDSVRPRAFHTCALSSTQAAFCWGGNVFQMESASPVRVELDQPLRTIATGHFHDCALTADGVAYCWGPNHDGEIGDGTVNDANRPQRVASSDRFVSIAAGGNVFVPASGSVVTWAFTCAVAGTGAAFCWGDNRHGTLGNGSTNRALTPTLVSDPSTNLLTSQAAGGTHGRDVPR